MRETFTERSEPLKKKTPHDRRKQQNTEQTPERLRNDVTNASKNKQPQQVNCRDATQRNVWSDIPHVHIHVSDSAVGHCSTTAGKDCSDSDRCATTPHDCASVTTRLPRNARLTSSTPLAHTSTGAARSSRCITLQNDGDLANVSPIIQSNCVRSTDNFANTGDKCTNGSVAFEIPVTEEDSVNLNAVFDAQVHLNTTANTADDLNDYLTDVVVRCARTFPAEDTTQHTQAAEH